MTLADLSPAQINRVLSHALALKNQSQPWFAARRLVQGHQEDAAAVAVTFPQDHCAALLEAQYAHAGCCGDERINARWAGTLPGCGRHPTRRERVDAGLCARHWRDVPGNLCSRR